MSFFTYESPLSSRYAGKKMLYIFSPDCKYQTWRELWLALAVAQKELGLNISVQQIEEIQANKARINYDTVATYEKQFRHDVMAHIYAFGDLCPLAKPILHLGATSCYVTDNGDLIQYRKALNELFPKLVQIIRNLSKTAKKYEEIPCLAYTHFQPAQPTTVGKRISLWLSSFLEDTKELKQLIDDLPFLGIKGATGTQASLLELFQNDPKKVEACDQKIADQFKFKNLIKISGQTYSRKIDLKISQRLTQLAASAYKFASDLRLLSHLGEFEEPSLKSQIGSSAMPYKKNPIYSERICALSRFIKNLAHNTEDTACNQWLERSLDDSANKRLTLPESFLAADAVLRLLTHLTSDLVIHDPLISQNLQREIPFLATENILMHLVKKGGNRQELHEAIRKHSHLVRKRIQEQGQSNDLLKRLINDPNLALNQQEVENILDIRKLIGLSKQQVQQFLKNDVENFLKENASMEFEDPPIFL